MNAKEVIGAFATTDAEGNVNGFNFADFDELVSTLVTERAKIRKDNKESIRAEKEAANEAIAEVGKAYYNKLAEGAEFQYKTADGTIVTAKKIKTKSGSGASAACEVISGIEVGKSNKRYPKFYQVIIPADAE